MTTFPTSPLDPNSFANNHQVVTQHLHLSLEANFEQKVLSGSCILTLKVRTKSS